MSDDPAAATYSALRTETAQMLNLDPTNLSLVAGLQLDLVSLLRLEVDALQGQVLAGQQVDLSRLATSIAMLRQLLPERSLVAAAAPAEQRMSGEHRRRLRELIEKTVFGPDVDRALREADAQRREEATMQREALSLPPEMVPAPPVRSREAAVTGVAPVSSPIVNEGAVITVASWARRC